MQLTSLALVILHVETYVIIHGCHLASFPVFVALSSYCLAIDQMLTDVFEDPCVNSDVIDEVRLIMAVTAAVSVAMAPHQLCIFVHNKIINCYCYVHTPYIKKYTKYKFFYMGMCFNFMSNVACSRQWRSVTINVTKILLITLNDAIFHLNDTVTIWRHITL